MRNAPFPGRSAFLRQKKSSPAAAESALFRENDPTGRRTRVAVRIALRANRFAAADRAAASRSLRHSGSRGCSENSGRMTQLACRLIYEETKNPAAALLFDCIRQDSEKGRRCRFYAFEVLVYPLTHKMRLASSEKENAADLTSLKALVTSRFVKFGGVL